MYSDILYIYKLGGEMTKMGDHNNDSRATRTVQVLVRSKVGVGTGVVNWKEPPDQAGLVGQSGMVRRASGSCGESHRVYGRRCQW